MSVTGSIDLSHQKIFRSDTLESNSSPYHGNRFDDLLRKLSIAGRWFIQWWYEPEIRRIQTDNCATTRARGDDLPKSKSISEMPNPSIPRLIS